MQKHGSAPGSPGASGYTPGQNSRWQRAVAGRSPIPIAP